MLPETRIRASGHSGAVRGDYRSLFVDLSIAAVPSGGVPCLDVYLQTSADSGATWRDLAHTQFTNVPLHRYWQVSGDAPGSTSTLAASDGQLAGESVVQGPFGDMLRLKWAFTPGGSAGSYTLAANLHAR